jgi:hypothetical protein
MLHIMRNCGSEELSSALPGDVVERLIQAHMSWMLLESKPSITNKSNPLSFSQVLGRNQIAVGHIRKPAYPKSGHRQPTVNHSERRDIQAKQIKVSIDLMWNNARHAG